jgi:hypothetical protein
MRTNDMKNPELANIQVEGYTREAFLVRGAVAAGAVYGLSTVGPFISQALAASDGSDIDILNYALTLEYLESAFYTQALKDTKGLSAAVKKLATTIRDDEAQHVSGLIAGIKDAGGTPVKAPGVDFGNAFANEASFLKTAETFEDLGVGAYNGAGPMIKSKAVLATAGSIVQVEGRHAGAIRLARNQPIAPSAFDMGIPKGKVLAAAKPFLTS